MALLDPTKTTRHDLPGEPEQWVEVRPLAVADLRGLPTDGDRMDIRLALLLKGLTAWSYDAPVDAETLGRLDLQTFEWLEGLITRAAGIGQ